MSDYEQHMQHIRDNVTRYEAGQLKDDEIVALFVDLWNTRHILKLDLLYREEFNHLHRAGHITISKNGTASIAEGN